MFFRDVWVKNEQLFTIKSPEAMTCKEIVYNGLEKHLREGFALVATDIVSKYGEMKASLNTPATVQQIFDRLDNFGSTAEVSLQKIEQQISESEKENPALLNDLNHKMNSAAKLLEFIQAMKRIEQQIIILRTKTSNAMIWGRAILDCKDYLSEIEDLEREVKLEGLELSEPIKLFSDEYSQLCYQCRYFFSAEYENFMKLPKYSKQKRDRDNFSITLTKVTDPVQLENLNQTLTAMNMIGQLPERIENWKNIILDVYVRAIIASKDGENVYQLENPLPNSTTFKLLPKLKGKKEENMNVESVLKALEVFFNELSNMIGNLSLFDATMQSFVALIGNKIEDSLIKMILQDVIAIAAPACSHDNEDQEIFMKLISNGEEFVAHMRELGFFTQSTKLMYNIDKDTIFVNRRCFAIVTNANKFIGESYVETTTVGSSIEENGENALDEATENVSKIAAQDVEYFKTLMSRTGDSYLPPLFVFQKCTVSKSVIKFVELLRETVKAAYEAKDEAAREKLTVTAQNIVRLYVIQSPRKHAELFTSVPTMAAIFYNNCYYLAHCIMTISLEVGTNETRSMLEALLIDSVTKLRDVAADCLEATLTRIKRDLTVYLEDHSAFELLPKSYEMSRNLFSTSAMDAPSNEIINTRNEPKLVQSLFACFTIIKSISNNLREVMTEIVYCKSIGSLISFLLDSLSNHVVSASDIRENDADAIAKIFKNVMIAVEELMMYRNRVRVTEFCSKEYFRLHEIVFVLGNRMQDIQLRWFGGKGPMAEFLTREEVVRLVKALFADSEHRKECISRL